MYRNDKNSPKEQKDFSLVKPQDLQMKVTERFTYLLFAVPDFLHTGYIYDFKIKAKTSNGEMVNYIYKDHMMRCMT